MNYIGSKDVSSLQKTPSGSIVYLSPPNLTLSIDVFTWCYTFANFFRHEETIVSTDTLSFLSRHRSQHHHDDQETRARRRNTSQAKIVLHQNFQTSLSRHARKPRHQCRTVQSIQSHTYLLTRKRFDRTDIIPTHWLLETCRLRHMHNKKRPRRLWLPSSTPSSSNNAQGREVFHDPRAICVLLDVFHESCSVHCFFTTVRRSSSRSHWSSDTRILSL